MIIWIASYPKSGNTWVRSFISSYIYDDEGSFNFELLKNISQFPALKHYKNVNLKPRNLLESAENWVTCQEYLNLDNKIHYLKTHNAMCKLNEYPFTNSQNTLGAIYLVRDPRDISVSYADHLNITIDEAVDQMIKSKNPSYFSDDLKNEDIIGSVIGSWSENYNSWKNFSLREKIIIKYEDLIKDPYECFYKIIIFLNKLYTLEINTDKIKNSINSTNFFTLQKLEKDFGFREQVNGKKFFRKGEISNWKMILSEKQINLINKNFGVEMKELKYL